MSHSQQAFFKSDANPLAIHVKLSEQDGSIFQMLQDCVNISSGAAIIVKSYSYGL